LLNSEKYTFWWFKL